jgi:hypothetical protein
MNNVSQTNRKWLTISSVFYTIFALIGAGVAITENRASNAGGWSTGLTPVQDFLYGNGTAISPPLYMIVAVVIFTLLALRNDRWGRVGIGGLIIGGLLFSIGMLVEPIVPEIFSPATFDLTKAVIVAGLIILPLTMMVFGIYEWRERQTKK